MYMNFVENRLPNKNLVDFRHRFCFVNKTAELARVTDRTKSLLDVILVTHAERYITSGNLQLGLSDHDLVFVVRKSKLPRPKPRLIEYRSMKNFDNADFLTEFKKRLWGTTHAPVKKKWVRSDQFSLRKHPFLLALRRWGRFARRNVCDLATEIPY